VVTHAVFLGDDTVLSTAAGGMQITKLGKWNGVKVQPPAAPAKAMKIPLLG
jgi:hypothetical protein